MKTYKEKYKCDYGKEYEKINQYIVHMFECLKITAVTPVSNNIDTPISNQIEFDFCSSYDINLVVNFQDIEEFKYSDLFIALASTLLDDNSSYVIRSYMVSSYILILLRRYFRFNLI